MRRMIGAFLEVDVFFPEERYQMWLVKRHQMSVVRIMATSSALRAVARIVGRYWKINIDTQAWRLRRLREM